MNKKKRRRRKTLQVQQTFFVHFFGFLRLPSYTFYWGNASYLPPPSPSPLKKVLLLFLFAFCFTAAQ